jgi:hypothetical protein
MLSKLRYMHAGKGYTLEGSPKSDCENHSVMAFGSTPASPSTLKSNNALTPAHEIRGLVLSLMSLAPIYMYLVNASKR